MFFSHSTRTRTRNIPNGSINRHKPSSEDLQNTSHHGFPYKIHTPVSYHSTDSSAACFHPLICLDVFVTVTLKGLLWHSVPYIWHSAFPKSHFKSFTINIDLQFFHSPSPTDYLRLLWSRYFLFNQLHRNPITTKVYSHVIFFGQCSSLLVMETPTQRMVHRQCKNLWTCLWVTIEAIVEL